MKKTFFIFPLTTVFILAVFLTGNRTKAKNQTEGDLKIINEKTLAVESVDLPLIIEVPEQVSEEEWENFRTEAVFRLKYCEKLISSCKSSIQDADEFSANKELKSLASFQAQVDYEKARLLAFEKNKINWEIFSTGFIRETDTILSRLKAIEQNKKPTNNSN